jgi:hypothetical protein
MNSERIKGMATRSSRLSVPRSTIKYEDEEDGSILSPTSDFEDEEKLWDSTTTPVSIIKSRLSSKKRSDAVGIVHIEGDVPLSTVRKIERDIRDYGIIKKAISSMEEYADSLVKSGSVPRSPKKTSPASSQAQLKESMSTTSSLGNRNKSLGSSFIKGNRPPPMSIGASRSVKQNRVRIQDLPREHIDENLADIAQIKMHNVCYSCEEPLKIHEPIVRRLNRMGIKFPTILEIIVIIKVLMRNGGLDDMLKGADETLELNWEYENLELLAQLEDVILGWMADGISPRQKIKEDYGIDIVDKLDFTYCCRANIMTGTTYFQPGREHHLPINKLEGDEGIFDTALGDLPTESDELHPVTRYV